MPNILLVVADQHRFDWIEGHDDSLPLRTPNIGRLQEMGVTFRRATTPSPLCAPARACLATGLDYDSSPVPNNSHDLPPDAATYYRYLRDDAGYFVAGVGKFDLHKATFDWNLDGSRLLSEWGLNDGIDNEGKFDSLWSGASRRRTSPTSSAGGTPSTPTSSRARCPSRRISTTGSRQTPTRSSTGAPRARHGTSS
jgi:arylsulfatase A-like enzyme